MLYLFLCVLFSSAIFIIFKSFDTYKINTLQAIIFNYFTAFTIGILSHESAINYTELPSKPWFIGAIILAVLFISVFNVMAITSQKNGVSVAAVAGKMAVVIPVFFGVFLYQEHLTVLKIMGVMLALLAVYFITLKNKTDNIKKASLIFPFLLFIGAGVIDTTLKYVQTNYVLSSDTNLFSGILFGLAGVFGIIIYSIKPSPITIRNGVAGIILGVINYYSIYYLLKALDIKNMSSAVVFSINNVSVVALSTLLGVFLFKEKLTSKNWIGIGIAIISIFLITQ
ncbi:MAG: DMT family transporter [Flavobacteriaceae bacterium]|nr:DMT family transporter [Flavobacteriaceae bacterium]